MGRNGTRVVVDARPLSAASATRGIGTYLEAILPRLATEPDLDLVVLASAGAAAPARVERVRIRRFSSNRLNFHEQYLLLPNDIRRARPDVFLSPGTDPPRRCLDVIPLSFPHPAFTAERRRWRLRARNIRRASAVVADSHNTATDAARYLGVEPARIQVIPLGVDPRFGPTARRDPNGQPFLLFVAEYSPHKGFSEAFDVISCLAGAGYPHRLVVVGHMGRRARALVTKLVDRAARPDRVEVAGHVPMTELVALYQQASLVVITSRYEGFGLPAAEAMACGTPVVAFDNSSLPEVLGDAGVLVADGDVPAFTSAAAALLDDSRRWLELSEAGLERALLFDWDRCAAELAEVIRRVAA
jgi:glycosyltransferase involved in cell wall biosynthesis